MVDLDVVVARPDAVRRTVAMSKQVTRGARRATSAASYVPDARAATSTYARPNAVVVFYNWGTLRAVWTLVVFTMLRK